MAMDGNDDRDTSAHTHTHIQKIWKKVAGCYIFLNGKQHDWIFKKKIVCQVSQNFHGTLSTPFRSSRFPTHDSQLSVRWPSLYVDSNDSDVQCSITMRFCALIEDYVRNCLFGFLLRWNVVASAMATVDAPHSSRLSLTQCRPYTNNTNTVYNTSLSMHVIARQ